MISTKIYKVIKKIRDKFEHGNYSIQLNLDIKEMWRISKASIRLSKLLERQYEKINVDKSVYHIHTYLRTKSTNFHVYGVKMKSHWNACLLDNRMLSL